LNFASPLPTLILLFIVAILCYEAAELAHALGEPPQGFSSFWASTPLLAGLLLLTPRRIWWALLGVGLGAMALADLRNGIPIRFAIWFSLGNLVEMLVVTLGTSSLSKGLPDLNTVKRLVKYVAIAVVLAPFVSGLLGAIGSQRGGYVLAWRLWFFSDALGFLTVTPAILSWAHDGRAWARKSANYLELAALMTLLGVFGYLIFLGPGRGESPALLYSLVPLLLWAALRLGLKGVSTSIIVIALLAISGAARDRGPFAGVGPLSNVLSMQLFLFFAAIPFMVLAVLVEEEEQTQQELIDERALTASQQLFRTVFENAQIGIGIHDIQTGEHFTNPAMHEILGYSQEELSHTEQWDAIVRPDELASGASRYAAIVQGRRDRDEWEQHFIRRDGRIVIANGRFKLIRDAVGKPTKYLIALNEDITERVKAEVELREAHQTLARQLLDINQELEMARQIQLAILPSDTPRIQGLDIAARYIPMSAVAGDFYDFIVIDDKHVGILIADVSGHGLPSALVASMLQSALAAQSMHASDPAYVLSGLNRALYGKFQSHFVTAAYLFLDVEDGIAAYGAAGHPPLLRWHKGSDGASEVLENGLPLGLFADPSYSAITVQLEPGDRIVLYTDGIIEATNPSGEQFGMKRLKSILEETSVPTAGQFADAVLDGLARWTERTPGEGHSDDITLLTVDCHC
jgi:PAS domain S-box-containing protein